MKRTPESISDYKIINAEQVIRKTVTGFETLKKVKKDNKGYYIRGRFYDFEPSKIYLEDFEERLNKEV